MGLSLALILLLPWRVVYAALPPPEAPPGFSLLAEADGVWLFRKSYPKGNPDYVQVIDLRRGARLELLHGQLTEPRPGKGSYGGDDPRLTSLALQTYWQQVSAADPYAFCVTNGGFFYMPEYPTRLAFPLKVDGQMVTEGWGIKTYPGQKLMLELWDGRADIRELTAETLHASTAPDIIAGLTEDANKRAKYAVGRTFFAVDDRNGDDIYETILVLNTLTARQVDAAGTLRSFGADKIMMLDGGGSTQLLCKAGHFIPSERPIPQAIAILSAPPPLIDSQVVKQTAWPVLLEGENLRFSFQLRNKGSAIWTPGETHLWLKSVNLGGPFDIQVVAPVAPEATGIFTQSLAAYSQPGVYPVKIQWGIIHQDASYEADPLSLYIVVLPLELDYKRSELESLLVTWQKDQPGEVESLATAWLEKNTGLAIRAERQMRLQAQAAATNLGDVVWVPVLMLPMMLVVLVLLIRSRLN